MNDEVSVDQLRAVMECAIAQAELCVPTNKSVEPYVGAVVWKDGKILASAHRGQLEGRPTDHAEFVALETIKDHDLRGATVFTTLEPCTRRNVPKVPCVERIISRGVKHVWIGMLDPNPIIKGEGIQRLRDERIAVHLFPPDLMERLEHLNADFIKHHRSLPMDGFDLDGFLEESRSRSLDGWYHAVNLLYWHKNFHVSRGDVFTHCVEVIGGLSALVSKKKKPQLGDEVNLVAKALAWWLALCGKVGANSVETILWSKFPQRCPYCLMSPHENRACLKVKKMNLGPDWLKLRHLGSQVEPSRRPRTIGDWVKMFGEVYPVQQTEDFASTFARLQEEMGELAEAVRVFDEAPGYFVSEAADVFAWLMHIENIRLHALEMGDELPGPSLAEVFARLYPDRCQSCGANPCKCPPILRSTIGRIGHEMPTEDLGAGAVSFFSTRGEYRVRAEHAIRSISHGTEEKRRQGTEKKA